MKIASALGQDVRKLLPIISHYSGLSRQKESETDDKTGTNVKSALNCRQMPRNRRSRKDATPFPVKEGKRPKQKMATKEKGSSTWISIYPNVA